MFRGKFQHTLDPKGRMSVPTRFRDNIPEISGVKQLVITWAMDGDCLWAYPYGEWEAIEKEIEQRPSNPGKEAFVREFIGNAHDLPVDRMGRVLVPPVLREMAGLNKQVVLVGALKKFEIWDQDRYAANQDSTDSRATAKEYYQSEDIRI